MVKQLTIPQIAIIRKLAEGQDRLMQNWDNGRCIWVDKEIIDRPIIDTANCKVVEALEDKGLVSIDGPFLFRSGQTYTQVTLTPAGYEAYNKNK